MESNAHQPEEGFKILSKTTPLDQIPTLHQYTRPGGLLGLMRSKSLWFSHIQFQNDGLEFLHALDIYRQVLKEDFNMSVEEQDSYINTVPGSGSQLYRVYTCSLTTREDLLSQWRGYCPTGGYSYSLCAKHLSYLMSTQNLILVECIYEHTAKKQFLKNVLGLTQERVDRIRALKADGFNIRKYFNEMRAIAGSFLNYAPALKHQSFREEHEWRLITYNEFEGFMAGQVHFYSKRQDNVLFREGVNTLIPYLELPLVASKDEPLCFNDIIISPNPNPPLAKAACELMLTSNGISAPVTSSGIPYRTW
jgi:hypothetical protein